MTPQDTLTIRLDPWQDRTFVRTFDQVRERVGAEGLTLNGPKAAARAEELLRSAGYSRARIDVERTIEEALVHGARWTVRRDGPEPASSR